MPDTVILQATFSYKTNVTADWRGLAQRWPTKVRQTATRRAEFTAPRIEEDLRRLLLRRFRATQVSDFSYATATERMYNSVAAKVQTQGSSGESFPWIRWGYFIRQSAGASTSSAGTRPLRAYIRHREAGWRPRKSKNNKPTIPVARIRAWLVAIGRQDWSAYAVARSISKKARVHPGVLLIPTYSDSSEYAARVNGTIKGIARESFYAAMGREAGRGELAPLRTGRAMR